MAEFAFRCEPAGVGEARRWLQACLRAEFRHRRLSELVSDAATIASELVTNAINAGCATGRLGWRLHEGRLSLWVFDDAPGSPVQRRPCPLDPHGRGLQIVHSLALESGTREVRGGKEAWATLALLAD